MTTTTRCEHDAPAWACRICTNNHAFMPNCGRAEGLDACWWCWRPAAAHTRLNPDPLRPPETDDPPPRVRRPGLCPHGAPLGRCWCPGPECSAPDDDYEPGHITPVGGWILASLVILGVLVAVVVLR